MSVRPAATLITTIVLCTAAVSLSAQVQPNTAAFEGRFLAKERASFETRLTARKKTSDPVEKPPENVFKLVKYPTKIGDMNAYLTPAPADGKKRPAIIWITGGFSNSAGSTAWTPGPANNDQSAHAFRDAGIVMMYPFLRGGSGNPGYKEGFYGEVDDVLSAAEFLAKQEYVDANRIYLGGHSTGGTMVLLASECSAKFRAVFSFGPGTDARGYGATDMPFSFSDGHEIALRAPIFWIHNIKRPTFVFEGAENPGNVDAASDLAKASKNDLFRAYQLNGHNHFSILAFVTPILAKRILADTGATCNIAFTDAPFIELN